MDELGFDFNECISWFRHSQETPWVLVKITDFQAQNLPSKIAIALRRCYATDELLQERASLLNVPANEILKSKLPNSGSIMAGDFGEIITYMYHSTKELPNQAIGVKKWRLKYDRNKPAAYSDVVHFLMPNYPNSSAADAIICSEVKVKSTKGTFAPISSAIKDCEKDRNSRLAITLAWLRDRALSEDLGDVTLNLLTRFINLLEHPPIQRKFRAVAVICNALLPQEIATAPKTVHPDFALIVISVPNLKDTYEKVFKAAIEGTA